MLDKALASVLEFIRRKDLDCTVEIPLSDAKQLQYRSKLVSVALINAGKAATQGAPVKIVGSRAVALGLVFGFFRSVHSTCYAKAAPALIDVLRGMTPADRNLRGEAIALVRDYKISADQLRSVFSAWIADDPNGSHVNEIVRSFPSPETETQVILAWKLDTKSVDQVTPEQRSMLLRLRISAQVVTLLVDLALRDLEQGVDANRDAAFFPVLVLRRAADFRGRFSAEQVARIKRGIKALKGASRAYLMWMLLLAPEHENPTAFLREQASPLVAEMARNTYLPQRPLFGPPQEETDSVIQHVHDLFLLSLLHDVKLDPQAQAALAEYCGPPQPSEFPVQSWMSGPAKLAVNHLAAFSLLWRTADDPVETLRRTWATRFALGEMIYSYSGGPDTYGYAFASSRQAILKGEPSQEFFPLLSIKTTHSKGRLACLYPGSDFAKANTVALLAADKDWGKDFVGYLYYVRKAAGPLVGIKGVREHFEQELTNVLDYASPAYANAACLLGTLFGERDRALKMLERPVREYFISAPKERAQLWGLPIEALLEIDPANSLLDEFDAALESNANAGWRFARWVLRLRRGKDVGEFPLEDYAHSSDRDVLYGLAFAEEKAAPYLHNLRNPEHLVGLFSSPRSNATRVLALMGALDRIEWFARKQERFLKPAMVIELERRVEATKSGRSLGGPPAK
jgi:hypothetical protein